MYSTAAVAAATRTYMWCAIVDFPNEAFSAKTSWEGLRDTFRIVPRTAWDKSDFLLSILPSPWSLLLLPATVGCLLLSCLRTQEPLYISLLVHLGYFLSPDFDLSAGILQARLSSLSLSLCLLSLSLSFCEFDFPYAQMVAGSDVDQSTYCSKQIVDGRRTDVWLSKEEHFRPSFTYICAMEQQ